MTQPFPRGQTAIVGAATFGNGRMNGYEASDLAAIAARMALDDAGLALRDVDGLFFMHSADAFGAVTFAQYLGIQPRIVEGTRTGGSALVSYVELASWLLAAGMIDVALIAYGSNQASATGKLARTSMPFPYEADYGLIGPVNGYAMAAARHMHAYGTTRDQLGEVAVAARKWAQLNPQAFKRDPLTLEDHRKSRMVSDPLSVLDCCLVTDGAAAVIMTRTDRARDLKRKPVSVLGAASATSHWHVSSMPDLTRTCAIDSGARAYAAASVAAKDIDVVQVYDAFTINTILFLEDLGFCAKGEGGAFVSGGRIAPGGALPVNTNGGGLSCIHPGMYGLYTIIEAARQLRGECGERQVKDAKLALAHGNGGTLSCEATVILAA